MAHLNVNFNEVKEQSAVPKGRYELQITGAEEKETGENSKRPGSPMLRFTLGFTDLSLNAPMISHYVTLPYDGDENANFKLLQMKRFLEAFSIPYDEDGIDTEKLCMDALGCIGTVEVGLEFIKKKETTEDGREVYVDDPSAGSRNTLILPKLPKDGQHPPRR